MKILLGFTLGVAATLFVPKLKLGLEVLLGLRAH